MAIFEVVPNLFTLQEAVDAALAAGDETHNIYLTGSPVTTDARVTIAPPDPAWSQWRLIISPEQNNLRATIASANGNETIFSIGPNARDVTFQDLDIIRHTTNNADLIEISTGTRITFDRCRIGSDWTSVGSLGKMMLKMTYPIDVLVRNCIFFSYMPGNFERGICAQYGDESNSVRLYNNVIADYGEAGIDITSDFANSLVLLRNNVVINRLGIEPEPFAYRSDVAANVQVVSSHNVAFFADPGHGERIDGVQPITGLYTGTFLSWGPHVVNVAFMENIWNIVPDWNPNPNFYRLQPGGPLHYYPSNRGVNVFNDAPHPEDIAVEQDIELDIRPSGNPEHTDRGADQIHEFEDLKRKKIYHWPVLKFTPYTTIDFRNQPQGDIDSERAFYFGRVLGSDGVFISGRGLPNLVEGTWFEPLYTTEEEKDRVYQNFRDFQNIYSKYGVQDNIFHIHTHNFCLHPEQDVRSWRADILNAMAQKAELMREIGIEKILLDHEYAKPAAMQQPEEFWYELGSEIMETIISMYPRIEMGLYPGLEKYYDAQENGAPISAAAAARYALYKGLYDHKGPGKIWVYDAWTYGACDNCIRAPETQYVWRINEHIEGAQTMYSELLGPEVEIMVAKWDFGGFQEYGTDTEKEIWRELKFPAFSRELFRRNLKVSYSYVQSIAFWDDTDDWDENNAHYQRFASSEAFEQWKQKLASVEQLCGPYSLDLTTDEEHWIKVPQENTLEAKLSYYRIFENEGVFHVSSKLWEDFPAYVVISREAAEKEGQNILLYSQEEITWAEMYQERGFFPNHELRQQGGIGSLISTL